MKNTGVVGIAIVTVLASGCGAKWNVTDPRFFRYQNKDIRLAGALEMVDESHQVVGGEKGADFEARLYTDDYSTMIYQTKQRMGKDLEDAQSKGTREIFTLPITQYRLGGTSNSYPYFCLEIRMDDSNVSEWTRVGCIHYTDEPSENPTGGISPESKQTDPIP